jgi:hypothetical protein
VASSSYEDTRGFILGDRDGIVDYIHPHPVLFSEGCELPEKLG